MGNTRNDNNNKCVGRTTASTSDFQSEDRDSTSLPRSKDRKIGRWNNCESCGKLFASFLNHGKWTRTCSRNCTQKLRSILYPKKEKQKLASTRVKRIRGYCKCGAPFLGYKAKQCKKCYLEQRTEKFSRKTLGFFKEIRKGKARHRYQSIRENAKHLVRQWGIKPSCLVCGYKHHVEVAHIKAIHEHDDSATVAEINGPNNLVYLCPNHHWELDNKL